MTEVQEIVESIDALAPIPPIAMRVLELAEDPDSSMSEIAELVRHDPAITANVLKICNSAYYGLVQKVESIQDALALLGLDNLTEMVLISCLSPHLKEAQTGYGLGEGGLWRHAITSAYAAVALSRRAKVSCNRHMLFTAALLKDIGKLVLSRHVGHCLDEIRALVETAQVGFNEAEKQVIGISHEELGAQIAMRWAFSERMVAVIGNHHLMADPDTRNAETLLVYLSDMVCAMMGISDGVDALAYHGRRHALGALGLSEAALQQSMLEISGLQEKIDELISLI